MAVSTSISNDRGVVSCDWFSLSCMLAEPRDGEPLRAPAGWHCLLQAPTAVWAERWFVLDSDGNKIATILCVPRSPIIDCKRCVVEIANRWLYYEDFHTVVDRVLDILPMAITGLNRVDLCCDFEMSDERYSVYKKLASGAAYVKALRSGAVWWQDIPVGKIGDGDGLERVPHCLTFGGHDSVFKWKVYYKWLELQQAPPEAKKPYIVDLWRDMGFSERHVWRCEVSISGSNSLRDLGQRVIAPFSWYDDRVRLFCDIYSDKFVVREAQGHKDKRNDKVLPFLEVVGSKSIRHALPSSSRDDSDPERRLTCKLWKELMQPEVQCNDGLSSIIRSSLMELLQRPANLWILERMYGVDIEKVSHALAS